VWGQLWHYPFDPAIGGTVANWFAAIGTVSAFAAGVLVIRRDNKWRRRDEEQRQDETRRAQAELVTGWWDADVAELELFNNSTGLVYRVVGVLDHELKPGHPRADNYMSDLYAIGQLPPGTERVPLLPSYEASEVLSRSLSIRFSDAAGQHWIRGNKGELTQTDEDPLAFLEGQREAIERMQRANEERAAQLVREWDENPP
jgi:hypothetical protein